MYYESSPYGTLDVHAEFEKHLADANVVITTPFHPGQMTRERIEKAKKLKLILTAGIGSDHIDLQAAADHGLTVAEVTGRVARRALGDD